MKKYIKYLIMSVMCMVGVSQLSAQTPIHFDNTNNNRAYIKAGIDPATTVTLGYERKFNLPRDEKSIVTYAQWGFSAANLNNSELKIGGILPLFQTGIFKLVNNLNVSAGTLAAKNFNSKKFAASDEIAFGIYKSKWFMALTAEYEIIYLNHIEHSDFYRETYFEDVVDGWYKGAGGMFQFGIEGGRTFFDRYDVHMEFKFPFTERLNSYNGSPAHINLGIGYRF